MNLVYGKDVVISLTDDLFPFACARSITLTIDSDMIETSTTGSGNFRTYIPGALSFNGTIEGLAVINYGSTSDFTIENLYGFITSGQLFKLKWYEQDVNGLHFMSKEAMVYIESLTETASFDNVVTFSANFKGSGPITITNGDI